MFLKPKGSVKIKQGWTQTKEHLLKTLFMHQPVVI